MKKKQIKEFAEGLPDVHQPGFNALIDEIQAENENTVELPKEQFEFLVMKAHIELMQRVNKMIDLLEKYGEEYEKDCD
jgi:hypothetical protein